MAENASQDFRTRLARVVFESDTPAGRRFDVALLISIVLSILLVMLESVQSVRAAYGSTLRALEWGFTGLFTLEYLLRLYASRRPLGYATSFFGVVDLLTIVPSYLSLFVVGAQSLLAVRALRLLRVFRILKLSRYLGEASVLTTALRASRFKITVFVCTVLALVIIIGSVMYLVEGARNGFTSIPISIYWAIVTLTTVGYGDISPKTPLGQIISSVLMIVGYGIIAVPTGIVTAELTRAARQGDGAAVQAASGASAPRPGCKACSNTENDADARYCKRCGAQLVDTFG
ncbi:MAG: Potassium voltage-gated channel subfamily KQT; possible potassium channel, VIC family [uncultured Truepera sp.]|uniref:Potassium voltage-gated channel subfamily KQT possible potassium channel, VIC family n=1 Tax=uncultured Truepera sp. TaxID=543023 RepID=A0A6J4VUH3_9DEIN|nr:MAG: Potassium voltage-gated channel subfamily KQT; possible potassium channel, VIC family [uncultured Truepera sp.]